MTRYQPAQIRAIDAWNAHVMVSSGTTRYSFVCFPSRMPRVRVPSPALRKATSHGSQTRGLLLSALTRRLFPARAQLHKEAATQGADGLSALGVGIGVAIGAVVVFPWPCPRSSSLSFSSSSPSTVRYGARSLIKSSVRSSCCMIGEQLCMCQGSRALNDGRHGSRGVSKKKKPWIIGPRLLSSARRALRDE